MITKNIKSRLHKTQKFVSDRQRTSTRLLVASMAFSGASTLVAGITSAGGPILGSGIESWRLACIVAAVFGFSSTISSGAFQQLESTDWLSNVKECLNAEAPLTTQFFIMDHALRLSYTHLESIKKSFGN